MKNAGIAAQHSNKFKKALSILLKTAVFRTSPSSCLWIEASAQIASKACTSSFHVLARAAIFLFTPRNPGSTLLRSRSNRAGLISTCECGNPGSTRLVGPCEWGNGVLCGFMVYFVGFRLSIRVSSPATVGGKKRSYYHDDLWNIKYLPKFKWTHLKIGTYVQGSYLHLHSHWSIVVCVVVCVQ